MALRSSILAGVLSGCALMMLATSVWATGIYEWTDEDGGRVFSDRPPPGTESREIAPPPDVDTDTAQQSLEAQRERLQEMDKERAVRAEAEQQKQREREIAQHNCEQARRKLSHLETLPRVLSMDDDGSTHRMDEPERQAKLEEARREIQEYCKD